MTAGIVEHDNAKLATLNPAASSTQQGDMLKCWREHWAHNMTMSAVPAGQYDVFLYVIQSWTEPNPATFSVLVQGATCTTHNMGSTAGRWWKLGPCRTTVSGSTLTVAISGTEVKVAGLEVRRVSGPTDTPTPPPTPTPTVVPTVPGTDLEGQIRILAEAYGVYLEDTANDGAYDYWRDPTFSQRVSLASRVDVIYQVITYFDTSVLNAIPGATGQRFKRVFGPNTVFRYTGESLAGNPAAETLPIQKNQNVTKLFNLTNFPVPAKGQTDMRCGSVRTGFTESLDITRCTIMHELGHVLVARAASGLTDNLALSYDAYDQQTQVVLGFYSNCPDGYTQYGTTRWDPGQQGWPWRDHPIAGSGSYLDNLCSIEPSIVIREMEADMVMNEILIFYNQGNTPERVRSQWTKDHMYSNDRLGIPSWIFQAMSFTGS